MQEEKSLLDRDNTKHVLVILLGWLGSTPRYLSKYTKIYDDYVNYAKTNEQNCELNITVQQFIVPSHMLFCNICMLKKWIKRVLKAIQSHRDSFGSNSYVVIHAFSNGGSQALCHLNDQIKKEKVTYNTNLLYYDGIIYDSSNINSNSPLTGIKAVWTMVRHKLMSVCVCYNINAAEVQNNFMFILCKVWSILVYCVLLLLALVILPIIFLFFSLWIVITCSADYILCYRSKLMGEGDIKLLAIPTLLLGSETDQLNPISKSFPFLRDKKGHLQNRLLSNDTVLLTAGYNEQFIHDCVRYVAFDESEHVKHYLMYPKLYQKEVNQFMDLCLRSLEDEP